MSSLNTKDWTNDINPSPIWNDGTDAQQEFADKILERFCKRFSNCLYWGIKNGWLDDSSAESLVNDLYFAIDELDSAKWWCDNKGLDEFALANKILKNNKLQKDLIRTLKKKLESDDVPQNKTDSSSKKQVRNSLTAKELEYDLSSVYNDLYETEEVDDAILESSRGRFVYLTEDVIELNSLDDCESDRDRHFIYNDLCELVYKNRNTERHAIELVKQICLRDLKIYEKSIAEYKDYILPTLVRLITIYKDEQQYDKALELCKFAIKNQIHCSTKTGYEGRYQKILKLKYKNSKTHTK